MTYITPGKELRTFIGYKDMVSTVAFSPDGQMFVADTKSEIQHAYPHQWLIVEALSAHTTPEQRRILDRLGEPNRRRRDGCLLYSEWL